MNSGAKRIMNSQKIISIFIALALLANQLYAHGVTDAEKQMIAEGGNLRFMWIGLTHMLSGYDHLAFIFGVIFVLDRFKDVVKFMTVFTLGHSITLILATYTSFSVNYYLIDAVIALSVSYKALHNLDGFKKYLGFNPPSMLKMVFAFGLIHGLGLSTRLQELPLDRGSLLENIVSFNIGVEVGQVSALALMIILMSLVRKSHHFNSFSKTSNVLLFAFGGLLFLFQLHGYQHQPEVTTKTELSVPLDSAGYILEYKEISDWKDTIIIKIPAEGEVEYKVLGVKEKSISYLWTSESNEVYFDFHGEPANDTTISFISYLKDTDVKQIGTLLPPFTGNHGWYWHNENEEEVIIQLYLSGHYERMDLK